MLLHWVLQNNTVESAIRKYNNKDVRWSSQGMMRLMPEAMDRLFKPTLSKIKEAIGQVLNNPDVKGKEVSDPLEYTHLQPTTIPVTISQGKGSTLWLTRSQAPILFYCIVFALTSLWSRLESVDRTVKGLTV